MTYQARDFNHLVDLWNQFRGSGRSNEESVRKMIADAISGLAALMAAEEKPAHIGEIALPGGLPISWAYFKKAQVKPHLDKLKALMERVDRGESFL